MHDLLKELRSARLCAKAGELGPAKQHIDEALELLDDAMSRRPGPKLSVRSVRGYIAEAGVAIAKNDPARAVSTLDAALKELE